MLLHVDVVICVLQYVIVLNVIKINQFVYVQVNNYKFSTTNLNLLFYL